MMAYSPGRIIPLESDILRLYICPSLPSSVQEVNHSEIVRRGHVELAGKSEPFLLFHERSIIEVSGRRPVSRPHRCPRHSLHLTLA